MGNIQVIPNTWLNTDPPSGEEALQHRSLILVLVKSVGMSPLPISTQRESSPYNSQILYSKLICFRAELNNQFDPFANKKCLKKINPFLPWH